MLDVFIAETSAVLAHGQSHSMAGRFVVGAGVFGIKSLDGIAALYADWHFIDVFRLQAVFGEERLCVGEHGFVVRFVALELIFGSWRDAFYGPCTNEFWVS